MSTRDYFCSVTSLDPIRAAVASNDDALVEAVLNGYAADRRAEYDGEEPAEDELREFQEYANSMIKCASPPKKEPGCWHYVVKFLAVHLGLEPNDDLPFNEGWKHYYSWKPYQKLIKRHITSQAMKSLGHLEAGRPFRGKKIDHDGCVFAWLSAAEVRDLYESLSKLDSSVITDEWTDFHETLVESLETTSAQSKELFMGAQ